jgi:hypothetical protein
VSTSSPTRRLLRRFTLGSGPLKRRSDRLEFLSRIVLALALLAAGPAGILAGTGLAGHLSSDAAARASSLVEVRATLLRDAPGQATAADGTAATAATWAVPGGAARVGTVAAAPGTHAGTSVPVWLDRSGRPAEAPTARPEIVDQALVAGAVTVLGTVIAGLSLHLVVVWLLGRQRARRWAAGWESVEPLWVTRFR